MSDFTLVIAPDRRSRLAAIAGTCAGLASTLWLAACAPVGPAYEKPDVTPPKAWVSPAEMPVPSKVVAATAELTQWWKMLGDSTLDSLEERAMAGNLDIETARSRVRQARAARTSAASADSPTLDAVGSASRARTPTRNGGATSNQFRAGFDAGWELDLFGATRRNVEASDAAIESAVENVRDVQVSLAAEVAASYVELRAAQEQLSIARRNLEAQRQTLDLTQRRHANGFVSKLDVLNARSQVAATEARLPSLEITIRQSTFALAALLGLEPGALGQELAKPMPLATLPPTVPVGLPSDVLLRRPDIRRSEADLHAAVARVGAATADLYPRISISGGLGVEGIAVDDLGSLAQRYWSIGPSIRWPILSGGAVRANIEQQKAIAEGAVATYKSTVLAAFKEVETSIASYQLQQTRTPSLRESVNNSTEAAKLASDLYSVGKTDFLNVLNARRSLLDAESSLVDNQRLALTQFIALSKALGGGWAPEQSEQAGTASPAPQAKPVTAETAKQSSDAAPASTR